MFCGMVFKNSMRTWTEHFKLFPGVPVPDSNSGISLDKALEFVKGDLGWRHPKVFKHDRGSPDHCRGTTQKILDALRVGMRIEILVL
jgi:hypothetical protein